MSTIASLISLIDPSGIKPWYEGQQGVNREAIGRQQAQTGLIELQQLKEKQAAEQRMFEAIQNDPRVREAVLGGGSILGSLGSQPGAGGMPAPAPMLQQTTMPGQPPGQPQMVPGGQDLSQFATQGGPPQSVLGSLGPGGQPQGQMQAPRNPVLEMAAQNPRAAMMLQGQMQAQQDRQWKLQEQKLKMGSVMMGSLGQMAQGVNDQDGWDQLRQDAAQIDPQLAARLPQVYSKEVRDRVVAQAVEVKDSLELQVKDLAAQAASRKVDLELAQSGYHGLGTDVTGVLKGLTDAQVQEFGGRTSAPAIAYATKEANRVKQDISERQGAAQEALKPLGDTQLLRFNTLTQAEDTVKKLSTEFTPEERAKFVGQGGMRMTVQQAQQLLADATGGKADPKFARFASLVALAKAEAFSTAGKALTDTEAGVVYGYIPTGKEYSAEEFEQKLQLAQERVPSMLDRELKLATTPRSELPGMRARGELGASTAGRTGTQASPTNQGATRKPVAAMSTEDLQALRARLKQGG